MATYIIDGGGSAPNAVGKAPVGLVSTWITSPDDIGAAGYLRNADTNARVAALYALGMQSQVIVDLTHYPLYALQSQFATDLAATMADFVGLPKGTPGAKSGDLYLVLHNGVEDYTLATNQAYMPAPLTAVADQVSVVGSTHSVTFTYQSTGGATFAGCPLVANTNTVYLDAVIGIEGIDPNKTTATVRLDNATGYAVSNVSTTSGITTFTCATGTTQVVVLTPASPDVVAFGGYLKTDTTTALFNAGHTTTSYRTALMATLGTKTTTGVIKSANDGYVLSNGRLQVGLGLTGSKWAGAAGTTVDVSPWSVGLAASDFNAINLTGAYSTWATMATALLSAAAQLSATSKPFMVSSFELTDPGLSTTNPPYAIYKGPDGTHFTNLTTAFASFLGTVFIDTTMSTLVSQGLFAWNWYNSDYLNTMDWGTSYDTLVAATNRYALPQHFYTTKQITATAKIAVPINARFSQTTATASIAGRSVGLGPMLALLL